MSLRLAIINGDRMTSELRHACLAAKVYPSAINPVMAHMIEISSMLDQEKHGVLAIFDHIVIDYPKDYVVMENLAAEIISKFPEQSLILIMDELVRVKHPNLHIVSSFEDAAQIIKNTPGRTT